MPWGQHHILAGCWIPAPSFSLLLDTELPEAADKHVLTGCEVEFDEFDESFDQFDGAIELISVFPGESFDDVVFGKGHWMDSLAF